MTGAVKWFNTTGERSEEDLVSLTGDDRDWISRLRYVSRNTEYVSIRCGVRLGRLGDLGRAEHFRPPQSA